MLLRLTSSTLALALVTAPALALTPEEVWTAWITSYEAMGYTVTEGSRDLAGETLTLTDVVFAMKAESEAGAEAEAGAAPGPAEQMAISVPQIVMQGAGDGSVRSDFSDEMAIRLDTRDEQDRPVGVDMTITAPGMEVVSSGDAASLTDSVTAPVLTVTVDRIDLPEDPDLENVATITMNDLTGESLTTESGRKIASSSRSGRIDYTISVRTADGGVEGSGSIESLEGTGDMTAAADGAPGFQEAMNEALKAGAAFGGTFKMGAATHRLDVTGKDAEDQPTSGNLALTTGPLDATFRMAREGIVYQGAAREIDTRLTGSTLPFPIAYKLAEAAFDVQLPVTAGPETQPFKVAYSLGGVTFDEAIWALFDQAGQLPRDPANLDIDVTGQMRVTRDLFDPALMHAAEEAAAGDATAGADAAADGAADAGQDATDGAPEGTDAPADGAPDAGQAATDDTAGTDAEADAATGTDAPPMPFEPVEVTINRVSLDAVGAKVSANGALRAPEGGDISAPVGQISARLEGVNGLIDKLAAAGLVPQEQVQGFRMMLAMFAKPGAGPDDLVSEIEFREGGQVFANGQQIK